MAKEYKTYDKKYRSLMKTNYSTEACIEEMLFESKFITGWKYLDALLYTWNAEAIRLAVYLIEEPRIDKKFTAEEWQKFRVSLKGQSTWMKLARLKERYERNVLVNTQPTIRNIERIRICNYISALRRGGYLDSNYEVVR